MELTFEAEVWSERGKFVARANPLNILSCGDTRKKAEESLLEAVELFLETAEEMGTLDDVLAEAGYASVKPGQITYGCPAEIVGPASCRSSNHVDETPEREDDGPE
jgi:predicted RNase H-like HicB family nuclease